MEAKITEQCKHHAKILNIWKYWQDIERRKARNETQTQCPKCLHWYFKDEMNRYPKEKK